ncbi:MAG: tetratricopeptide repeat protein [Methanothrix sp.]|nr:tetratricopeptide repeat protein [Methanothrix sp.]
MKKKSDYILFEHFSILIKVADFQGKVYKWLRSDWRPWLKRLGLVATFIVLLTILIEYNGSESNERLLNQASKNNTSYNIILNNVTVYNLNNTSENMTIMDQLAADSAKALPKFYNFTVVNSSAINVIDPDANEIIGSSSSEAQQILILSNLFLRTILAKWLEILLSWLLIEFILFARMRRNRIVIEEFKDRTSYKPNEMPAQGLSELLAADLFEISDRFRKANEMTSIQTTTGAGKPIDTTINVDALNELLRSPLTTESNFGIGGGLQVPIKFILSVIDQFLQGPKIVGCVHCAHDEWGREKFVYISAQLLNRQQSYSWKVSSIKALITDAKTTYCTEMVEELAYRIFSDIQFNKSGYELIRWKAIKNFSEGLRSYKDHLRVPANKKIKLNEAEKNFFASLVEDDKFPWAYYNLGVVYAMLKKHEAADKAFSKFIERSPDNLDGYYARALNLFNWNKQNEEEIKETLVDLGYPISIWRLEHQADLDDLEHLTDENIVNFCSKIDLNHRNRTSGLINIEERYDEIIQEYDHIISILPENEKAILAIDEIRKRCLRAKQELSRMMKICVQSKVERNCRDIIDRDCTRLAHLNDELALKYPDCASLVGIDLLNALNLKVKKENAISNWPIFTERIKVRELRLSVKRVKENYDTVIKLCDRVIETKQENDESILEKTKAYDLKGLAMGFQGKYNSKNSHIECHNKAAKNSLIYLLNAKRRGQSTVELERIAVTCMSNLVMAELKKAANNDDLNLLSAKKILLNAKKLSPNNSDLYTLLGRVHNKMNNIPESIADFEIANSINPESIEICSFLALQCAKGNENQKNRSKGICAMVFDYFAYPSVMPGHIKDHFFKKEEILYRIACAYKLNGEKNKSGYIKIALKRIKYLKFLEIIKKKGDEALPILENQLSIYEGYWRCYEWKTWRYAHLLLCLNDLYKGYSPKKAEDLKKSHYKKAIQKLEKISRKYDIACKEKEYANIAILLGKLNMDLGDRKKAKEYYENALNRLENNYYEITRLELYSQLASLRIGEARSLDLVNKAISLDPLNSSVRNTSGHAQFNLGFIDNARTTLENGFSLNPENPTIRYNLGVICYRHSQESNNGEDKMEWLREAADYLHQALELYDTHQIDAIIRTHYWLGMAHFESKDYVDSINHLTIAEKLIISKDPKDLKFERLMIDIQLGKAYLENESYDDCEEKFRDVIRDAEDIKKEKYWVSTIMQPPTSSKLLEAEAHLGLAQSFLRRDAKINGARELALCAERYAIIAENEKDGLNDKAGKRHAKHECSRIRADCRDVIGICHYKSCELDKAIEEIEASIDIRADARAYLHLAIVLERKLKLSKIKSEKIDLVERIKLCCQHVEELDIMKEYSKPREELLRAAFALGRKCR